MKLVKLFAENGEDIDRNDGESLRLACENSRLDIVKYLVENGAKMKDNYFFFLTRK
ncbi:hypothetical protein BB559_000253, partial [Furculomyces boomerangus]